MSQLSTHAVIKLFDQSQPHIKGEAIGYIDLNNDMIGLPAHEIAIVPDLKTVPGDITFEKAEIVGWRLVKRTEVETRTIKELVQKVKGGSQ